ncbi:hypothetical protein O2V63_20330 [Modestobacter sp. VKM Ac-2977]|uniref:hypothetical protein n=1 Tax=Modestobacter sp. VKM Ac-2977 TaxID=3004131 RepID=UPI0022AA3320|nr:hypothetical protein [Modestobacter sp. VKM Ac-2977]MCZ2822691.1 hypothetical protein [Modestobacter sp. VKM Ac-2977]
MPPSPATVLPDEHLTPQQAGVGPMSRPAREFGEGPLSRATAVVYWFLVVELLLAVTAGPSVIAVVLLDRHPSNIPLVALAAVPVGPALAAAVFAWRVFDRERDTAPARHFWRGYRLNALDVLRSWVPGLAVLTVLGINLTYREAVGLPAPLTALQVLLAVGVVLWMLLAVVITALFRFRARDVARLGAHYLGARPLVTLGLLSWLVLCAGIAYFLSDWVLWLLASPLTFQLTRITAPVAGDVTTRFLAGTSQQ